MYYGDVRQLITTQERVVAFIKHHLIFYHAPRTDDVFANIPRANFNYHPLDVNIQIYNKATFDISHHAQALKSVYTNYLFNLLQLLHAKYGNAWLDRIQIVDYMQIQSNVMDKLNKAR